MASTAFTFWFLDAFYQIFWMIPIMGFCQLALFGGYAIYFPELFPTRLRSTGTSFCYNVGRLVAAAGPLDPGAARPARVFKRLSRAAADPLRRRDHVRRLPDRPAGPALRPRDQGQAAAGMRRLAPSSTADWPRQSDSSEHELRGVAVEVEPGAGVAAEGRGGARLADRAAERGEDGLGLARAGHDHRDDRRRSRAGTVSV